MERNCADGPRVANNGADPVSVGPRRAEIFRRENICRREPAGVVSTRMSEQEYRLVRLRGGAQSVHSERYGETIHPGLGPAAEAETLYAGQLRIVERMRELASSEWASSPRPSLPPLQHGRFVI